MKIVSSEYLQNMLCTQIVVFVLFWHSEQFWYTICSADVASFWKRFTCMKANSKGLWLYCSKQCALSSAVWYMGMMADVVEYYWPEPLRNNFFRCKDHGNTALRPILCRSCVTSWARGAQFKSGRTLHIKEEEMTLKWSTSTCAYFNFYSSLIQCGLVASELAAEPNGFHDAKAFLTSHLTELKPRRGYEIHHHRFPLPSIFTKKMTIKVTF